MTDSLHVGFPDAASCTRSDHRGVGLDDLTIRWQWALDAGGRALDAASAELPQTALARHRSTLVHERAELMKLQNPQVMKTMKVPNMTADLGKVGCPTLTLWGINDQMMPESGILRIAKGVPNGRVVLVPKCGHWVMIEHRDLFNRYVLDFLKNG